MSKTKNNLPIISDKQLTNYLGTAILNKCFCNQFIFIEHPTEKDFGIDFSVEHIDYVSPNYHPSGKYAFVQLKSHKGIKFNNSNYYGQKIKKSTINYWLQLDMPLLLILVDISNCKIYAVDALKFIRENYSSIPSDTHSTSISVFKDNELNEDLFKQAYQENLKYNTLLNSSFDVLVILNFIKYFDNVAKQFNSSNHCLMLVYKQNDFTHELLSFINKYNCLFDDYKLKILYENIKLILKEILTDEHKLLINYEKYNESIRIKINKLSFAYFILLSNLILDEIKKDQTNSLKMSLSKFIILNEVLKKYEGTTDYSSAFEELEAKLFRK